VILKIDPKAGYKCTLEKIDEWKKRVVQEKQAQKSDAAFRTIFSIRKYFQRSKQRLHINFFLELGRLKNHKTIGACTESTDLIV
jgi:hypothetical protein